MGRAESVERKRALQRALARSAPVSACPRATAVHYAPHTRVRQLLYLFLLIEQVDSRDVLLKENKQTAEQTGACGERFKDFFFENCCFCGSSWSENFVLIVATSLGVDPSTLQHLGEALATCRYLTSKTDVNGCERRLKMSSDSGLSTR